MSWINKDTAVDGPKTNQALVGEETSARHARKIAETLIAAYAKKFDASNEAVAITDAMGIIRYVNPAFTLLTGYAATEIVGQTPRALKSGKHDAHFYKSMWTSLLAGNPWHGEIFNRKKDGTVYVDDQTITPIRAGDGSIGCFISVRHDATSRYKAAMERARREEETSIPLQLDRVANHVKSGDELIGRAIDVLLSMHIFREHAKGVGFVVDERNNCLRMVAYVGQFSTAFLSEESTVPLGECLCGRAAVEGRVLTCTNCFHDDRHERRWLGMGAHGHYTIPIRTQTHVSAVINLYTDAEVESSSRNIAFLASIGFRLGSYLERTCEYAHITPT